MTNREYLIKQLSDENFIDDGGASYEATIFYHIACPYHCGNREALCKDINGPTIIKRETCSECKNKWLDKDIDE